MHKQDLILAYFRPGAAILDFMTNNSNLVPRVHSLPFSGLEERGSWEQGCFNGGYRMTS